MQKWDWKLSYKGIFLTAWFVLLVSRILVLTENYSWPVGPVLLEIVYLVLTVSLTIFAKKGVFFFRRGSHWYVLGALLLHTLLWGLAFVDQRFLNLIQSHFKSQIMFAVILTVTVWAVQCFDAEQSFVKCCSWALSCTLIFQLFTHFSEVDLSNLVNIMSATERTRANFGFGHYNTLGAACACNILLLDEMRRNRIPQLPSILETVCLVASVVMLLCSASRSALTSLILYAVVYAILDMDRWGISKRLIFAMRKLASDVWYINADNQMYRYYGPGYYTRVWKDIDGERYFLNWVGVAARGVYGVQDSPHMPEIFYLFDLDTCALVDVVDGFMTYGGNTYYYHTRGANAPAYGFWCIDGYYYYFSTSTGAMRTGDYTVMSYASNGLLTENRTFHFDETHGYAVDENGEPLTTLETEKPETGYPKFVEKNGKTYYYRSADALAFGFWQIDGYYYYFSTSTGEMRTGDYTVQSYTSNGMLTEARTFHFDETHGYAVDKDGNPLTTLEEQEPVEAYPKFVEKNGKTYYYRNANGLAFGLWQIDGYYYYFSTSTGEMRTGDYTVMSYASNGLLTENRTFHFDETHGYAVDEDGNPITSLDDSGSEGGTETPEYPKFVVKDGKTYCYKNANGLYFGFQQINGYYYYFSTSTGEMRTGDYTVLSYASNGLLDKHTTFHFDETHGYAVDENGEPLTSLE